MNTHFWRRVLLLSFFWSTTHGALGQDPPAALPPPTGRVALRDALAAALVNSRQLSSFSWQVRVEEARVLQSGVLPNPELTTELEDFAGSGARTAFKASQTTISIAQLVELGGKRAKRLRLASLDRDLAAWDYEATRLDVLADVSRAFTATLAAQQRIKLSDELLELARRSVAAVSTQVTAGATSPIELQRAEAALGRTEVHRRQLERDLKVTRAVLAATWGSRDVTFSEVDGDLTGLSAPPAFERIRDRIDQNPDLARWTTEIEQRQAALSVERARVIPSVTLGAGARYLAEGDDGALVAGFSVPLPIFDRNQGSILAAERRIAQAEVQRDRAAIAVTQTLAAAYEDLGAAYAQAAILRDTVLPKAEAAFTGARDAYQRGLLRFLDVLDAQRTLSEVKDQYIQTLAAYHAAVADVERLSGSSLASLSNDTRTTP